MNATKEPMKFHLLRLAAISAACLPILAVTVAVANNQVPPQPPQPLQPSQLPKAGLVDAQDKVLMPRPPGPIGARSAAPMPSVPPVPPPPPAPSMPPVPVASVPEMPPAPPVSSTPPAALHFNNPELKLTPQERAALELAKKWKAGASTQGVKPAVGADGAIRFLFGATQPSIVCAVLQVCDVELQPGEQVNSLHLGDTARWTVEPAVTGSGKSEVQHLIIKPMDTGLETSLIVTTDRRTYHLRLRSHRTEFMPRVAFTYPEDAMAKWEQIRKQEHTAYNN